MIPKIIHTCWFGPGKKSDTILRCEESLRRVAPEYTFMFWNDNNCPQLPYIDELIHWKKWALLSDYVRLHILLEYGGIYLDTDVELIRSIDELLNHSCVIGFEMTQLNNKCIGNAVLAATSGHTFIEDCYRMFLWSLFTRVKPFYGVNVGNIVAYNRGLSEYGTQSLGDIHILAKEFFYPEPSPTENSYCIHHQERSWHRKHGLIHDIESIKYRAMRCVLLARRFVFDYTQFNAMRFACPKKWDRRLYKKQLIANKVLEHTNVATARKGGTHSRNQSSG